MNVSPGGSSVRAPRRLSTSHQLFDARRCQIYKVSRFESETVFNCHIRVTENVTCFNLLKTCTSLSKILIPYLNLAGTSRHLFCAKSTISKSTRYFPRITIIILRQIQREEHETLSKRLHISPLNGFAGFSHGSGMISTDCTAEPSSGWAGRRNGQNLKHSHAVIFVRRRSYLGKAKSD